MLPVSVEWKNAIKEQFRFQGYLEVLLQLTPPGLHEGLSVATSATEVVSDTTVLTDEDETTPTPYITLEHGRWILNGKYKALPQDTKTDDWWSTPMGEGEKILDFSFDQAYSIPGTYIEWDLINGSYPVELLIEGYNNAGDLAYTYNVTSISSAKGFVDAPMDNVRRVTLTIKEWSRPTWRARINEIMFGLYAKYGSENGGRVISATSIDSSSPLSKSLPIHTISVELRNVDGEFDPSLQTGVSKYFAKRQLIRYRWGFMVTPDTIEWTPQLSYYMESFKIPPDSKNVVFNATSRLAFLTDKLKNVEYDASEKTFYDLAVEVLEGSNIIKTVNTEKPWMLSEELKNYSTNSPMPDVERNVILQYIANAASMQLYIDPESGFVIIDKLTAPVSHEVSKAQELGDPGVVVQEQLRSVTIAVNTYTVDFEGDKESIGQSKYLVSGEKSIHMVYTCDYAVDVSCSVSGATLVRFTPHGTSADVDIKAPYSETEVQITLTGRPVTLNKSYVETYRNKLVDYGLDVVIENPLITNTSKLYELTNTTVNWYTLPQQQQVFYSGYPEITAGDAINLSTVYGDNTVRVIKSTLKFNGGFDGVLEVR